MKRSWWRTGPPIVHTRPVQRPMAAQWLRQLGVLCAIAAIWGGGFLVLLGATASSNVAFVAQGGTPERRATPGVTASFAPTAVVTNTITSPTPTSSASAAAPTKTAAAHPTDAPPSEVTASPAAGTATDQISFQRDVLPIFTQICVKCHGGEKTEKSLVLKSYDDLMQGSENGPVVEPGDPANSLLVDLIQKGKMPKRGPKLLPAQIRAITDWVAAGAPNN